MDKIRLLISSPGDVDVERRQVFEVVDELNRTVASQLGLTIEALDWIRDTHPGAGRPQQVINEQLDQYQIFVGIMWRRFGTPTGAAGSGTEEEFLQAYESWKRTRLPKIMFYFCKAPAPPPEHREEATQLMRVVDFRERLAREHPLLSATYTERSAFKDKLRPDLHKLLVREFTRGLPPIATGLQALLELQKEVCARRNAPFLTPNVLLALLQRPDGMTRRSLDALRLGLADELRDKLQAYVDSLAGDPSVSFVPFHWEERGELQRASELARREGAREVGEKHLLLGVLEGQSNTIKGLEQWLGEADFRKLIGIVREQPDTKPPPIATPGFTLSS